MKNTHNVALVSGLLLAIAVSACGKKEESSPAPAPAPAAAAAATPTPDPNAPEYKWGFENHGGPLNEPIKNASMKILNNHSKRPVCILEGTNCIPQDPRSMTLVEPGSMGVSDALTLRYQFDAAGRLGIYARLNQIDYYAKNVAYDFTLPQDIPGFKKDETANLFIGESRLVAVNDGSKILIISDIEASQDTDGLTGLEGTSTASVYKAQDRAAREAREKKAKELEKAEKERAAKEKAEKEKSAGSTDREQSATDATREGGGKEITKNEKPADSESKPKSRPTRAQALGFSILNDVSMTSQKIVQPTGTPNVQAPPNTTIYSIPGADVRTKWLVHPAFFVPNR